MIGPKPTLEQVTAVLTAYKECFGKYHDVTLELDYPEVMFKWLNKGQFGSYRVGSRWTDDSRLTFIREAHTITVDFYLNNELVTREQRKEIEAAEKEFYRRVDALRPTFSGSG